MVPQTSVLAAPKTTGATKARVVTAFSTSVSHVKYGSVIHDTVIFSVRRFRRVDRFLSLLCRLRLVRL